MTGNVEALGTSRINVGVKLDEEHKLLTHHCMFNRIHDSARIL
jgi:hypothetical protein